MTTSTAQEWMEKGAAAAAVEAEPLTLPSGTVIRARRPDPLLLALWGSLPLELVGTQPAPVSTAAVVKMIEATRELLEYCVVEPRISLGGEPGTIHPRKIHSADLLYIVKWARGGEQTEALRDFRGDTGVPGDRVGGEDVRRAAEHATGGDRSSGVAGRSTWQQ